MKILAMADLHGDLELYLRMKELFSSREIEAVVIAGDLLSAFRSDISVENAMKEVAQSVVEILISFSKPVFYIMGNDDLVDLGYEDSRIRSIHCERVTLGKYSFVGYQYSLLFTLGPFEKPETEIQKDMVAVARLIDVNTVLVTHSPAYGILDEGIPIPGRDVHVGSRSILDLIERNPVKAHIHGHIHNCFGRSGIHFNVASAGRFRGMIIDLDDLSYEVFDKDSTQTL